MEQRDPPRFGTSDGRTLDALTDERDELSQDRAGMGTFPRLLKQSAARHWSGGRIASVSLGALGILIVLIGVGSWVFRQGHAIVRAQAKSTLSFREITLDPPPPRWYRGGAEAFLDRVARKSKHKARFSILELDLGELRRAFELDPIVEAVSKVRVEFPNRVIVRIAYHEPVAKAKFADRPEFLVVDRFGTLLPLDVIDLKSASPLIELHGFPPPREPRDGYRWYGLDPKTEAVTPDRPISEAARLADFLRGRIISEKCFDQMGYVYIHGNRQADASLFVQVGSNQIFSWQTPGAVGIDPALTDEARWLMLRDWVKLHDPLATSSNFDTLKFTPRGVELIKSRPKPVTEPMRSPN